MASSWGLAYVFDVALMVALLMLSASVHELSHGLAAHLCGDDTAKEAGRLTLNPLRHLDPVGSLALPLVMALAGGVMFAYAKPVPYDPRRLRNRRRDEVLVALAGPASNLVLACLFAGCLHGYVDLLTAHASLWVGAAELPVIGYTPYGLVLRVLLLLVQLNLSLCFFNLIPLPPLDGSKVLCRFLKGDALARYYEIQSYSMPILIVVLYVLPRLGLDPVGAILDLTAGNLFSLLLGGIG